MAIRILLIAFGGYLVASLLGPHAESSAINRIQVLRLLMLSGCHFLLRGRTDRKLALYTGVFTLCAVTASVALNGVLRAEQVSTAIVSVALTLGTGAFLPWGATAQACVALFATSSLLLSAYLSTGDPFALGATATLTMTIAMGTSVLMARDLAASRRVLEIRLRNAQAAEDANRAYHSLVAAMHQAELRFITERDPGEIFSELLEDLLDLTRSRYGLVGEVLTAPDGHRYLRTHAISDISWNAESRAQYDAYAPNLEFHRLDNLFGWVITHREAMISNDPIADPRRGGLPGGHPPISNFLGLPLIVGEELVGLVGLANRPEGYDQALVDYLQPFLTSCAQMTRAWRSEKLREHAQDDVRRMNATLEERVRERTADLEAANRDLSRFSASVSHDLRSPVRTVASFSHLLITEYFDRLDAAGRDYLLRVHTAGIRMGVLIDDLLSLARLGRGDLAIERVDLGSLARTIVEDLRGASPERVVEVVINDGVAAHGDPGLLRILLENLLGNAWKFTAREPVAHIEFGSRCEQHETIHFVRDNGVGFDMSFANKLFRLFERLNPEDGFEGTGIGLATVDTIVRRHKGRVWAEGAVGEGATFYFALPG